MKKIFRRFVGILVIIPLFTSIFVTIEILISRDVTVSQSSNQLRSIHSLNHPYWNSEEDGIPLLTLFTTFKETHNSTFHRAAHAQAVANWASLRPAVRSVLFAQFPHSNLSDMARRAGWDVIQLRRWNEQETPFLKDMFSTVFQRYNSTFYGFANGDILFDNGLTVTLQEVKRRLKDVFNDNVLLIGNRINMKFSVEQITSSNFSKINLTYAAMRKGKLDGCYAQDYFFFTRDSSFNWSSVADVVIGRPGYDNYLVIKALEAEVNVIDATKTMVAVHLTERNVSESGRLNPDSNYNLELLKGIPLRMGLTSSSQFLTKQDVAHRVYVIPRKEPSPPNNLL